MYEDVWDRQKLLFMIKHYKDSLEAFENSGQYLRMKKHPQIAKEGDFQVI